MRGRPRPRQKVVDLPAGATSTLDLAVLTVRGVRDPLPNVPIADFGGQPHIVNAPVPLAVSFEDQSLQHDDAMLGIHDPFDLSENRTNAVLPGRYTFFVDKNFYEDRVVAAGQVGDLAFRLPVLGTIPPMFETTVSFIDAAELPIASNPLSAGKPVINCGGGGAVLTLEDRTPRKLKAYKSDCPYRLVAAKRSVTLDQTATNNITLHRVDVDHVVVTREDGSTFIAHGNYTLESGGDTVFGPVPTGTGVDVLPGSYVVVVNYATALGPQVKRYPVSF